MRAKLEIESIIPPGNFKRLVYTYEHKGIKRSVHSPIFEFKDTDRIISALYRFADQLICETKQQKHK